MTTVEQKPARAHVSRLQYLQNDPRPQKEPRMTRIRHISFTLIAFLIAATAAAQGMVLTTYNIEELGRSPGLIELSPNFLSVIEFEDAVQSAATGRSDLIQTSVDGNTIILRPTRSAGSTDLIVQVGGRTTMFI